MSINYKTLGIQSLAILILGIILYFVALPAVTLILPFIIAGIVAQLMEPLVGFMERKFKMSRKLASLLSLFSVLIVFGSIISFIIYKVIIELVKLSNALPNYFKDFNLNNEVQYWTNLSKKFYLSIPPEAATLFEARLNETIKSISTYASHLVTSALTFVLDLVKFFPTSFIFLIIALISTYFISSDRIKIKNFILRQFPENWAPKISGLKNDLLSALIGFLKAQLMLISISMVIAFLGFTILGVEYTLTMAIIVGFAEIIPVVGTGSIFIPWIIYWAVNGNLYLAVGLAITFIIGVTIRQLIEPKILGTQIGIYPLVALISIYIGLELFGVLGMILGPITVILLKSLNKSGLIRLWKE